MPYQEAVVIANEHGVHITEEQWNAFMNSIVDFAEKLGEAIREFINCFVEAFSEVIKCLADEQDGTISSSHGNEYHDQYVCSIPIKRIKRKQAGFRKTAYVRKLC